jgi:flagellar biosynthesis regulator FlaF
MMADTQNLFTQEIETWTGLTKHWAGIPKPVLGTDIIPYQLHILTDYADDIQQYYAKTYRQLMDPLLKGNKKLSQSVAALMRTRDPEELAKFQFALIGWMVEGVSYRTQVWTSLANNLAQRNTQLTHDLVVKLEALTPSDGAHISEAKTAYKSSQSEK